MYVHWTYSKIDLYPAHVHKHELGKIRSQTDKMHIGGLEHDLPVFTHCITADGRLFDLKRIFPTVLHLALIGGVDENFYYKNTATREQLHTLSNIIRFHISLGREVKAGDLKNWDFEKWLQAIKP